ncbi:RHS repeat domain-containing protein [Micromonospora narathiwatensis]|uniref:RHS repeat-associated core domain-containing protein n=1 Tax=Micromonospora narathiwatensis TaxID=299146 RepID=A0A1A8Z489_9ACTN|nr:RHS repeat-associated core domain-containing protein [Micromonospora narathiwatensis]SBT38676.1 RHS repeat-associated core domain-containing protein [Micromonospora narathiwatensis]
MDGVRLPLPSLPRPGRTRLLTAAATAALMAMALISAPPAASAATEYRPPAPRKVPTVPVSPVAPGTSGARAAMPDATRNPAPAWPAAGAAEVDLAARPAAPVGAGALPVRVRAAGAGAVSSAGRALAPAATPSRMRVEVLDRAATERAGVRGVLLRVGRTDGVPEAGSAQLTVDYARFATAYGADWAARLRLVSMPVCALTEPGGKECAGTPLRSTNDLKARTVSAAVPVAATNSLVAVMAGDSSAAGDYKATSLQPSSTWTAGGNSGAFTWNYPMRVPPSLNGPAPSLALSYSSHSVDGRQAASNNQPSWAGEGFEANPGGFIERRYLGCGQDMDGSANNTKKTSDLCWATDNATLSLGGHSGELLYNATEGRWHLRSDDGSRIERKTGASNGDNNGEYWVVTTTDGTQYWFGVNRLPGWASGNAVTNSTLTAPVFGNHAGEPCHATAFIDSSCAQAWRWNLDYVVDVHGNSASYWYTKETNKYGRNLDANDATSYDRAGYLDHISYGTRRDSGVESVLSTPAPAQVVFGVADRCLSSCATHDAAHWPDTPWDQQCTGSNCGTVFSPTFWTTKRLATVTTQIRSGSSYSDVERWTLTHTFPDPGDGTRAGLWLSKISHAGLVGTATTVPDIEFTGVQLPNRVDTIDFAAAMNWWRIAKIQTETGGTISVTYSGPDCVAGQTPTPQTNTKRCYPSVWTPEGYSNPVTDWFHKYVVTTVYEQDNTGGAPPQGSPRVVHTYSYLDGAAWHYSDDDGLIEKKYKTWSSYRGYGRVAVTTGDPGEQTYTETRYFRGMDGDRAAPSGGTKSVTIDGFADADWFAGLTREVKTFNGPDGAVVSRETSDPWGSAATATRTINGDTVTARFTRVATTRNYTTLDGGRGERATRTTTTYDSLGMAIQVDDFGQDGVAGDEQCQKIDYGPRNDTLWLMDKVHRTRSYAVQCSATTGTLTDADVITEERTSFDGQAFGTAPTRGLATKTEKMTAWNAGAPAFATVSQGAYDKYGRVTTAWDAMNAKTTTAYTPATGGPVTATTVTNALQHVASTTVNPAWGSNSAIVDANNKRTELAYDGLGRLTAVWLPGRDKATQSANVTFSYLIRNNAATVVSTSQLNPAGAYNSIYALYDGLLRLRQTQSPSPSGGRLLTDTFYDTAGREVKAFGSYHSTGTPGTTLVTATERAFVPTQTRTVYDGAGRPTASVFQPYDAERWRTSVYYAGDRTDTTPPAGGTATSTLTDARGRTVSVRQYHGTTPTPGTVGSWDTTSYAYNRKGQLTGVTDALGNQWLYEYDLQGRRTKTTDPDTGVSTFGYDAADRVTLSTDGRGKKLAYLYDPLGRKRAVYDNAVGGTMRAQWVYDTIAKGRLSQSTRFVGSAAYQTKIVGYTDQYQPTGVQVVIPTSETNLAGTYDFFSTYNIDGSVNSASLPSTGGDLPAETLSYTYDALGQPTTMTSLYGAANLSYVAGTTYNALGELDQLTLDTDDTAGGRVWQAFTHELETGRLTGVRVDRDTVAPNTLSDVRYTYDNAGNITKAVDVAPDPVDDTQCFTYDHLRRLTDAWTPSNGDCAAAPSATALGGPAPYWHSWTFDPVGNRKTQVVHTSTGNTTTTYGYPAAKAAQPHTLSTTTTGSLVQNYKYDESGNTICRPAGTATNTCPTGTGSQVLTWDPEGHLETSTDATGTTTYIYDADGNRLIRRDPAGKTLYLPGEELRYTNGTGTATCTRYYAYGGSLAASRTGGGLTWLAADHQGTANVSVSANAAQTATVRRQNPYGNPRGGSPTWANDKGFVGGTKDNTGLTHLGAREYDPATGRFVSVDPVFDLQNPQSWTGYGYSSSSPVTFSDPSGLKDCAGAYTCDGTSEGVGKPPKDECFNYTGSAQRRCEEKGPSGQNTSAGQATGGSGSGDSPRANLPTIPPEKKRQLDNYIRMVVDQNPDTWNIPGSPAYNAIMVRLKHALFGSPTWKDYWEALDQMVVTTVVAAVGAALCPETAGAGCMLAVAAYAGAAGQCMDDCEDTQALALAAVLGAATDGLGRPSARIPGRLVPSGVRNLTDGAHMSTSDALNTAVEFLGPGYRDMGGGRFLSQDGLRQVRLTDADLAHPRQDPHINFETYNQPIGPGVRSGGPATNIHIYLPEEPGWHTP